MKEKYIELLKYAKILLSNEYDSETNPVIGLQDEQLVLWVFYKNLSWTITLDDFDFENIESELIKSREEMIKWINENPDNEEKDVFGMKSEDYEKKR
jgi:hypothetical protein